MSSTLQESEERKKTDVDSSTSLLNSSKDK